MHVHILAGSWAGNWSAVNIGWAIIDIYWAIQCNSPSIALCAWCSPGYQHTMIVLVHKLKIGDFQMHANL